MGDHIQPNGFIPWLPTTLNMSTVYYVSLFVGKLVYALRGLISLLIDRLNLEAMVQATTPVCVSLPNTLEPQLRENRYGIFPVFSKAFQSGLTALGDQLCKNKINKRSICII
jgi:hypothetical protein